MAGEGRARIRTAADAGFRGMQKRPPRGILARKRKARNKIGGERAGAEHGTGRTNCDMMDRP